MNQLIPILQELEVIRSDKDSQLANFLNKNLPEFVEFILKDLGKDKDDKWNYVRQGWLRNKFKKIEGDRDFGNLYWLDDEEDDIICVTTNPQKTSEAMVDSRKKWKKIMFKNAVFYYFYY